MLDLKIITGLSGAGKTQMLRIMEDFGYYAVDHLPVEMIVDLIHLLRSDERGVEKVAIVVDIRENGHFQSFFYNIKRLEEESEDVSAEIIYLEADNSVLLKRYHETRRRHPLDSEMRLLSAIEAEKQIMEPVRRIAHRIIDTGHLSGNDMRDMVRNFYGAPGSHRLLVSVVSFGYKYGLPQDLDYVFDARLLPNPYYDEFLRPLSGQDEAVADYIAGSAVTKTFTDGVKKFLDFVLETFEKGSRDNLVIGFGCTGGRHRSVFCAETIGKYLSQQGYICSVSHNDMWRGGHQ